MTTVESIKIELTEAAEECREAAALANAAVEIVERALGRLAAVSDGTSHPAMQRTVGSVQQSIERLRQGAQLAGESADAAREYSTVLG